jgi:mRNA interferase RelE/StbE
MSEWQIVLSRESLKFLRKNHLPDEKVTDAVVAAIRKLSGENVNVDLKKLNPPYEGYFRIRIGRMRITLAIDFRARVADVADIKWRSGAYR